jgi:hypothetical protein
MSKPMTPGEIQTLKTILRFGGDVTPSMGRKTCEQDVRTSAMNSLQARGFIRLWSAPRYVAPKRGFRCLIVESWAVTARGCVALAEATAEA